MIGWIIEDFIYDVICYWIGHVFLKVITLGRFPNQQRAEELKERIKLVGLIVLVALLALVGWILS
jgi:hypothetical protein